MSKTSPLLLTAFVFLASPLLAQQTLTQVAPVTGAAVANAPTVPTAKVYTTDLVAVPTVPLAFIPEYIASSVTAPLATRDVIARTSTRLVVKDEFYWKDRMRVLQAQLDGDQTFASAARTRERALNAPLHRKADDVLAIHDQLQRALIERQWQDAVTDVVRLIAVVRNDTRDIATLKEEARRAGVKPGWLLP